MASIYVLLAEFPSANTIAAAHLTRLTNLLEIAFRGHYSRDTAILFREVAKTSIGLKMLANLLNRGRQLNLYKNWIWRLMR